MTSEIRPDWCYRLASVLQSAVGDLLDVDGHDFAAPCVRLAERLPLPITVAERLILKSRVMEFALRIGDDFHALYHRRFPNGCGFFAIESEARIWFDASTEPRNALIEWASAYARTFSRHHRLPAHWKVARVLQQRPQARADIRGVAREAGVSRSTLVKGFTSAFGITPFEYHTRVRLRYLVQLLRSSSDKVRCVSEAAGFRSAKIYGALRRVTGLRPSAIREMTSSQFEWLLSGPLQTDPTVLARGGRNAELTKPRLAP